MKIPSNELVCRTLFYHAASDGRAQALFGPDWEKTCDAALPYTRSAVFPNLYLEFPLKGDPFLDVTVESGMLACPETVAETAPVCEWVKKLHAADERICAGFELDAATAASGPAAEMSLSRGFPAEDENGSSRSFALLIRPDWVKARWHAGALRNAKCYCWAWGGLLRDGAR